MTPGLASAQISPADFDHSKGKAQLEVERDESLRETVEHLLRLFDVRDAEEREALGLGGVEERGTGPGKVEEAEVPPDREEAQGNARIRCVCGRAMEVGNDL